MKKIIQIISIISIMNLNAQVRMVENENSTKDGKKNINYPKTKQIEHIDTYFDMPISDPYHWLEDDKSDETTAWVKTQNEVTNTYFDRIPFREEIKERMTKLWNYEKISAPFKEGKYTYYYKNNGLQNQSVLYRQNEKGLEEIFLDPNTFSKDGTTSLDQVSFSKDGSIAAYSISESGSDWRNVIFIDAITKKVLSDKLIDVKFSGLSWKGNEGIYYSSYDKPKGSELSAKTDQHKLYYHKLKTLQVSDKVIFGDKEKRRYVGGYVSEDDNYLFVSAANSTSGNELYLLDLTKPETGFVTIMKGFEYDVDVIDNIGSKLFISTNYKAPNKKVISVDASYPMQDKWADVIPEIENVLSPSTGSGYIFANYMIDAVSFVQQYDYEGKKIAEIKLPGLGTVSGFAGKHEDKTLYYTFSNYITPSSVYKYNVEEQSSEVYKSPKIDFNPEDYESNQTFYKLKDGTKIPIMITSKKGLKLDGKNPTILYGYGGFNISITPSFSIANAVWLENNGILAVANIRGGGEYGQKWHDAGTKMNKQNVFDDFIAAADFLKSENYTSTDYLALKGGSNGGLLVGAVMTQRPDLAKVALPAVGVLDMLRYHKFTSGAGWAYDYGTSEDSNQMFEYLKNYSPLHNINTKKEYPATLITTGDHDDRVVPAHSFKFAARLQECQKGENPTLIRIDVKSGHGAGKSTAATIQENVDIQAFTLFNMGIKELPRR
jgi:prolyl oligopeptidase